MASRHRDDFFQPRSSDRELSILRAPVRQEVTSYDYLETDHDGRFNETWNQQYSSGYENRHGYGTRYIDSDVRRNIPPAVDPPIYNTHVNEPTSNYSRQPYFLDRDNYFNRSFSHPSDRSDSFKAERSELENAVNYNRSFSQPQTVSENYFDINRAIHEELINNPWATYRRKPRRRDRYAMYVPNIEGDLPVSPPLCEEFRFNNKTTFNENALPQNTFSPTLGTQIWDEYYDPWSVYAYGTYRRAPRTYPRIDTGREFGQERPAGTRDTRRDGVVFSNLCKVQNGVTHRENNYVMTKSNIHTRLDNQHSVQHLFSVELNDVKQLNRPGTSVGNSFSENSRKLNKIENNLKEKKADQGLFRNIIKGRRNRMTNENKDNSETQDTEKKPFFYCRWVADYPKTLFLVTLGGHILIALVTVVLLLSGYDLFPTEFEFLPMYDMKVPWFKRDCAWRYRDEYQAKYVRKWYIQGLNKWYRSMHYDRGNIVLYYDTGGRNIFTKQYLKQIEIIEQEIANMHNYTNYCQQTQLLKCQKLTSVLRYFDGTYANIDPVFNDTEYNNIAKVLYTASIRNETKGDFAYFLSKDNRVTEEYAHSRKTRTLIPIGFPIKLGQSLEEMEDEMEQFLVRNFKPVVKKVIEKLKKTKHGLELIYFSYLLFKHDIVIQIFYDLMFAVGSVIFIFGFIVYHTKSLWISAFAVSSILTSFLCTNIIYRVVLDFRYFGFFHVITLFIILGIGADDLFVFLDVWKNTGFERFPSLAARLSSAYKKSMKSMFFTSLTTAVAFFASSFSPLLSTKSFGVFAGVLVIVNYLSVVLYFPTVVVLHHLYFKTWSWPCYAYICGKFTNLRNKIRKNKNNNCNDIKSQANNIPCVFEDNSVVGTAGNRYNVVGKVNPSFKSELEDEYGFVRFKSNNVKTNAGVDANGYEAEDGLSSITDGNSDASWNISDGTKQKKILVRFFRDYYFKFVTHWILKWIIVIFLTGVLAFFMYCISTMETENEPAQFYRNSHNYGKALDLDFHGFVANKNDRNVVVYIVWGLNERNMSRCHFSDARCVGTESYDTDFNPNSLEAQVAIKKFCEKLKSFSDEDISRFKIRRDFSTGKPEIKCFATDLESALKLESVRSDANLSLPWSYKKTIDFMQSKSLIYNTLKFNSSFPNMFEIPISYWLNDGYRFQNKENFDKFHYLIGEGTSYFSTPMKSDFSVFYGNRIVYMAAEVNLTLGRFSSGYPEGKPVMDRWENFVQEEVRRMPDGMRKGFQTTQNYWHNLSIQKTIENSAITGIVVGIVLAFPILTFATQNILIGFFATLSICCSTICVVGMIPLAGYRLGLVESLNMCMVVGLTVDYVVHLAEGYHLSKRLDRKSRVQDMLEVMGISVFSGACTTLGASLFMFFAQIQFIIRFGMFMFSTIGFSLLYSLGFFTTIMGILGPSGDCCDLKAIAGYIVRKYRTVFQKS